MKTQNQRTKTSKNSTVLLTSNCVAGKPPQKKGTVFIVRKKVLINFRAHLLKVPLIKMRNVNQKLFQTDRLHGFESRVECFSHFVLA